MAISAHEAEFPVASLGILATLIPCFVAASISTPSRKVTKIYNEQKQKENVTGIL